jgi:uncharacterized membrane protein
MSQRSQSTCGENLAGKGKPMHRVWLLIVVVSGLSALSRGDEPVKKLQVVTPKADGIIATGINGRGEIVGFEWVEEKERPGVLAQVPFLARGKEMTYLPLLATYTATFPAALSDDSLVVGRVSKPAPLGAAVFLRNQGFVWDARTGIRGLGALAGDSASFACGISRDGRRISGFSVGEGRIRACYWDRDGEGWKGTPLPQAGRLGSNVIPISDHGKFLAGVDGVDPCLWSQEPSGQWTRQVIGDAGALIPRAVNDSGTVVGYRADGDGLTHAIVWTRAEGCRPIVEPAGYVRSEANAINNAGAVVGLVDGPGGSKIGPNAFVFEAGRLRLIDEGGPAFISATAINDQGQVAGVLEKDEEPAPPRTAPSPTPRQP